MSIFSEYLEKTAKENLGIKNTKIESGDEVVNESNNLSPDELNFQSNFKQVILKALDNDIKFWK